MITKKKKRWGITFGFKIEKLDELNVWMCVPLSGWTRCICAVCGVQYIPIYILISHTHFCLCQPLRDWWQSCIISIDYYCLWFIEGQSGQTQSALRDAVVMGTSACCRAAWKTLKFSVRSARVMPVNATARFALRRKKLCFFFPLSLSLFSQLPCVPSWTLFLWKRSRETVQDMARAQKRRELFVHLEKEVGMDEILLWLDADRHSFWAERQNHTEAQQRMSPWGIRALLSYLLSAEGEKNVFL